MTAGTILLVEDEPALRGLIQRMLVGAGYEVLEARNGAEALQQYQAGGVDVVLTDVHMPHVDGLSLVYQLWNRGNAPQLLVMSARRLESPLPPGAVFLRKPFTREELLDHVRVLTLNIRADIPCEV